MEFKYICEMDKYNSTIGAQNVDYHMHGALFSWTEWPLALRMWNEYQTQGVTSNHCTVADQGHGWSWSIWYNRFTRTQPQSPRIPTLYLPTSNTPSISWHRWSVTYLALIYLPRPSGLYRDYYLITLFSIILFIIPAFHWFIHWFCASGVMN